jgi:hypothetical protein
MPAMTPRPVGIAVLGDDEETGQSEAGESRPAYRIAGVLWRPNNYPRRYVCWTTTVKG